MSNFKQTRKVGVAGGFINQMMGNNQTYPIVGKGATELMYSDRHAWEVISVSDDHSRCTIQAYDPERIDNLGMSDSQSYKYEKLTEEKRNLVWRKKQGGTWCSHGKEIRIIPKIRKQLEQHNYWSYDAMIEVYGKKIADHVFRKDDPDGTYYKGLRLVDGITKEYDNYHPISIIFGIKEKYYDFSF
tara:strand:+ start:355 stop:912 length:558 start_codon:yes stop_codon:yes gene_type:complete